MYGEDYYNKLILICYNQIDQPIATNISFWFTSQKTIFYHIGLFLIIPEYQKQGIQSILG